MAQQDFVVLNKDEHKDLKIKHDPTLAHGKESHLIAIAVNEYARAASSVPIVLIKDDKNDTYHSTGLYGLEANKNLYFSEEGWQAHYAPLNLQRYPFDIRPEGEQLIVFIDQGSELVNKDEGQALFDGDKASEYLESRQRMLGDLVRGENMTREFIKEVDEMGLIDELNLGVIFKDGTRKNLVGLYNINEKKLHELTDEQVLQLHRRGFMGAIYAMLTSVGQLNRLVQLSQNSDNPVQGIQVLPKQEEQQQQEAEAPTA
ncbi:hypothetical protein HMF8227_02480 [Saliniradius amylolyticus]|uniref:Uncharacterized protein n=1 Tax=Saliniradius amylolyticus TaxID=2183582 RepID=A0A2S2E5X0_9ALTE|nr:SapC family protein [Saliniradius amylolyticus]AWL12932.1 hypothetical protein HMF8227_02480 [Saliniradius amylolyticus]